MGFVPAGGRAFAVGSMTMTWRAGIGPVTTLLALWVATPAQALELARTSSLAEGPPVRVELGASLYLRVTGERSPGTDWTRAFALQRAKLGFSVRWGDVLRADIEPDFGGGAVGVRDAFLEIQPTRAFDVRIGRQKSPHGYLDHLSRWELPSLGRGLWNDVLVDRLGFGGRQVAVLPRLRLKDVPLKPWVVAGVLGDLASDDGADAAAAVGVKLSKGLDLQASWHHRAGALVGGGHGNAAALALAYDRGPLFVLIEGSLGEARRLRQDGRAADHDAAFVAARARVAVRLELVEHVSLEPVLGGELLDPELTAGSDLGFEILGGASVRWYDLLRVGAEASAQLGQARFVVADRVQLIGFLGVEL